MVSVNTTHLVFNQYFACTIETVVSIEHLAKTIITELTIMRLLSKKRFSFDPPLWVKLVFGNVFPVFQTNPTEGLFNSKIADWIPLTYIKHCKR